MGIISKTGKTQWRVRLFMLTLYVCLGILAFVMLYPMALILSKSTLGVTDTDQPDVIPAFLHDDTALLHRHFEAQFNEELSELCIAYGVDAWSFKDIDVAGIFSKRNLNHRPEPNKRLLRAWQLFLKMTALPDASSYTVGYFYAPYTKCYPMLLRECARSQGFLYDTPFPSSNQKNAMRTTRQSKAPCNPFFQDFLKTQPIELRNYLSVQGVYQLAFLKERYEQRRQNRMESETDYATALDCYNASQQSHYTSWGDIPLPRRDSENTTAQMHADWEAFVRHYVNCIWVRLENIDDVLPIYHAFLKKRYADAAIASIEQAPLYVANVVSERRNLNQKYTTIEAFNTKMQTHYPSFDAIPLNQNPRKGDAFFTDWNDFVAGNDGDGAAPLDSLVLCTVETLFQDWIVQEYGSVDGANLALGTAWTSQSDISLPQLDAHVAYFQQNKRMLRREFLKRNYISVWQRLHTYPSPWLNSLVYSAGAIILGLVVNSLTAYTLSRFKLQASYRLMLFIIGTLALPTLLVSSPNFYILRAFRLTNSLLGILLPTLANGFSIFILKYFFDSQQRHLYEAAQLDGANEWVIFRQISMKLARPAIAVIGLNIFIAAYSNIRIAHMLCPDPRRWTLLVCLFDIQQQTGQGVAYATIIIAAVPILFAFAICQYLLFAKRN